MNVPRIIGRSTAPVARSRWRRSGAVVAGAWVLAVALLALLAPWIATSDTSRTGLIPHSPQEIDLAQRLEPPAGSHVLGTDELGRDVAARLIHGARVSLTVGILATLISLGIGAGLGAVAGYLGGRADWVISRVIETVLCFPFLFLVLGIVALFEPSMLTVIIALGLTSWTTEARFVRGECMRLRDSEMTLAARAAGASDWRIVVRHLLPNALAPALVSSSFGVATAILTESALSFLGLGVPLPAASWGGMLAGAHEQMAYAWWLLLFPGLAIFSTVVAFNVLGESARVALDPRQQAWRR